MQRTKLEIIDYFQEFIFGFIYNDINKCIKATANYIVTLALLSYTEYLGALIGGHIGLPKKGGLSFTKALSYFPEQCRDINSSLGIEYKDEKGKVKTANGIYKIFRCGVVHEYFIKGPLTKIINNPGGYVDNNRIGIEIEVLPNGDPLYQISSKRLIFRTNEYFRDFKAATDRIYKELLTAFDLDLKKALKKYPSRNSELLEDSDLNSLLLKGFYHSLDMYTSRRMMLELEPKASNVAIKPTFKWPPLSGATSYDFELTTDPIFATITEGTVNTVLTYLVWDSSLEYKTIYHWRVRAISANGVSPWVTSFFTTLVKLHHRHRVSYD